MSHIDAIAGLVSGEKKDWTPSKLIEVFCAPGLRSGFRESGRKDDARSDWHAGFCSYAGTDAYGPGIDGFDDGHTVWGDLLESGWSLIMDPGDRQFPYAFCMSWRPRLEATGPDAHFCVMSYAEGDFGIDVYDDEPAFKAGVEEFRQWEREHV